MIIYTSLYNKLYAITINLAYNMNTFYIITWDNNSRLDTKRCTLLLAIYIILIRGEFFANLVRDKIYII